MTTFVIGGAGFIGQALVPKLLEEGRRVVVVGRRPRPQGVPEKAAYLQGDYHLAEVHNRVLEEAEEVVDLAYSTAPKTSFDSPLDDLHQNVGPAVACMLAAQRAKKLKRIVLISSGGVVYGNPDRLPLHEDHPTRPVSPYGITKLAIEHYARMYFHHFGLPFVVLRPGNAYGPMQRPFAGQGFIATAMGAALKGEPVDVYGEQGTVRDYVHVEDVANAIAAALAHGTVGEVYNVGTGVGSSNLDILRHLDQLTPAAHVEPRILPARPFDVRTNVLDSSRLSEAAGWRARIALDQGLASMWEVFRRRHADLQGTA